MFLALTCVIGWSVVKPKPSWVKAQDLYIIVYKDMLRTQFNAMPPSDALLCKDVFCCA